MHSVPWVKSNVGGCDVTGLVLNISVKQSQGGYNLIDVNQFLQMDRGERMKLILERRVQFLDEAGGVIPVKQAIKMLYDK